MKARLKWFGIGMLLGVILMSIGLVDQRIRHAEQYDTYKDRLIVKEMQ